MNERLVYYAWVVIATTITTLVALQNPNFGLGHAAVLAAFVIGVSVFVECILHEPLPTGGSDE